MSKLFEHKVPNKNYNLKIKLVLNLDVQVI